MFEENSISDLATTETNELGFSAVLDDEPEAPDYLGAIIETKEETITTIQLVSEELQRRVDNEVAEAIGQLTDKLQEAISNLTDKFASVLESIKSSTSEKESQIQSAGDVAKNSLNSKGGKLLSEIEKAGDDLIKSISQTEQANSKRAADYLKAARAKNKAKTTELLSGLGL